MDTLDQDIETVRQYVKDLESQIEDLRQESDEKDSMIRDLQIELDSTESLMRNQDTEIDELSELYYLAMDVAGEAFKAEVLYVDTNHRFGVKVLIDVDMTPGEALYLTPGKAFTLVTAAPEALARLRQAVQAM